MGSNEDELGKCREELKKKEEEFKNLRRTFSMLIEKNPIPMAITNREMNILDVNDSYSDLTGYSKEDVVSKNMRRDLKITETTDKANVKKSMKKEKVSGINIIDTPKGRLIVIVGLLPYKDVSTGTTEFLMTFTDITEVSESEKEIRSAKMLVDRIIDTATDCMCIISKEGSWIRANHAWKRVFGYEPKELLDKRTEEQPFITSGAIRIFNEMWKSISIMGQVLDVEMPLSNMLGEEITVLTSGGRLVDETGNDIGRLFTIKDITKLKRHEEDINTAVKAFGKVLSKASSGDLAARVDLAQVAGEYKPIGEDINKAISADEKGVTELKEKEEELEEAISIFGETLSKAAVGDLSARAELNVLGEEYRSIGEDINSMIKATEKNISELREKEKEVGDAKVFSDQIIDTIMDPLCVVDNDSKWIRANPAWERLVGYKPEELLGKKDEEQPFNAAETVEICKEKLWEPLYKEEIVAGVEVPYLHKNGKEVRP